MKTLIFSPAAYNLAETTRCLEIAKACQNHFEILFISYGGEFENLIEQNGFSIRRLEPQITPEKAEHIYKVDQGTKLGYLFSVQEVEEQVRNEIALFEDVNPAAVVTGFNMSNDISCRVVGVPLVWLTHSTWLFDSMMDAGLGTWPDMLDFAPLNWLPEQALLWLTRKAMTMTGIIARPYNQVGKQYGLPPIKGMEDIWEGDYNLLAEPEEFCELELPSSYHYIPPLIGRLDTPIPEAILNLPKDKPIVYFAMGSSGQPKVIAKIVEGFSGQPYRVIAPVKKHLQGMKVQTPENVLVTDWLPAHKVNPMADISVIHGGIGTVMTACLAGKPVVGVSMMIEQEANIDCLVRKGFAIRIRKNRLTPQKLHQAIETLLSDPEALRKAQAFQKIIQRWDDPTIITDFFVRTFDNSK
jgi:UDP:flavonoid glycosyltransferase YjiC (YdhE family)